METRRLFGAILLLAAFAMAGCSDNDPSVPEPEQIMGLWHATKVEYVGATSSYDLVAAGASVDLLLSAGDVFQYTVTWPAESPEVTTGDWTLSEDVMTLSPDGLPFSWEFDCSLLGGVLRLTGADAEWDFEEDGTPEAAELNVEFVR